VVSAAKVSPHQHALAQKKAQAVQEHFRNHIGTCDENHFFYGLDAETCFEFAGSSACCTGRTVRNHFQEFEESLGRTNECGPWPKGNYKHVRDVRNCNGKGSFRVGQRGMHERTWLLGEEDYLFQFKRRMKNTLKELSANEMARWVNEVLLVDVDVETSTTSTSFGVSRPARRNTVHQWMKRAGASNGVCAKSFCNVKHEDLVVLGDRQHHAGNLKKLEKSMR
jgi:hypothetical protein